MQVGALVGLAFLCIAGTANAIVIYESATLGTTGLTGGFIVGPNQYLGSRFTLSDTFEITSVGGHLALAGGGSGSSGFVAIIELGSLIPGGFQFTGTTVLATALFDFDSLSILEVIPVSLILGPGDYALVFGSGLFGATAVGVMPTSGQTGASDLVDGVGSYFFWNGITSNWQNGGFNAVRFEVSGKAVPEPASLSLFLVGLAGLGFLRRRRNRRRQT